jgi:ribosomal protein S18 acetylase RimI-like enzyme
MKYASGLQIRECTANADSILALWRVAGATPSVTDEVEDIRRALRVENVHFLIGELDGKIVASVIGSFDGWRGNIYRLAVDPAHRRRGFARSLVAEVKRRFAEQGVKRVTVLVEKDHPLAMGFWRGVGFTHDTRIVRFVLTLD